MKPGAVLPVVKRTLRLLLFSLLTAVLLFALYLAAARPLLGVQNPTVFGFSGAVVLTGSMSGALEPDDLIITRRQKSYTAGDVISFSSGKATVTHRILAATADGYQTKGDANNAADAELVPAEKVLGRVVFVLPKAGRAVRFVKSPAGMLCLLVLLFLLLSFESLAARLKSRQRSS